MEAKQSSYADSKPSETHDIRIIESNSDHANLFRACGESLRQQLNPLTLLLSTLDFFTSKIPNRIRNFFIEAFYVSKFRKEWGTYMSWIPQLPLRPKTKKRTSKWKSRSSKPGEQEQIKMWRKIRRLHERKMMPFTETLPKPVSHDHTQCKIIRLNVAGMIFETQERTLNQFPNTLLGHPGRRIQFFDPATNEYFFDRNRTCFEAIMYYYQTGGVLRRPFNASADMFLDEIKFFDLDEAAIEDFTRDEGLLTEDVKDMPSNLLQRKMWLLFEYPESSYQAKIVALISVTVIIDSILIFCIETLEIFQETVESTAEHHLKADVVYPNSLKDPFYIVETSCVCWFGFEFMMRLITCPNKCSFFMGVTNIIDLIAIVPYFLGLFMYSNNPKEQTAESSAKGTLTVLRVIRLVRVFRILKLSRHNRGLKILGMTLKASFRELGLLIVFLMIAIIVFSSAAYFAERGPGGHHGFSSVPESFWWAVCTMTTLGYGDMVPYTVPGKLVGSLCCIAGVLTLALPVPIIVSNFNVFYHREDKGVGADNRVKPVYEHVIHCPLYSATYGPDGSVLDPPVRKDDDEDEERWMVSGTERDESDTEFNHLRYEERLKNGEIQIQLNPKPQIKKEKEPFSLINIPLFAEKVQAKEKATERLKKEKKAENSDTDDEAPPEEFKSSYSFYSWRSSPSAAPLEKPSKSKKSK